MPFNPFRRRPGDHEPETTVPAPEGSDQSTQPTHLHEGHRIGVHFDGLTEDWRIRAMMDIDGRLSDVLNHREAIAISEVTWAPIDGSEPFEEAPGLKSIDPYDLVVVLAGEGTLPQRTNEEQAAHRIYKVFYDVDLDLSPFRVVGTIHMFPGSEPGRLLDRATELFVPVTDATALLAGTVINPPDIPVVLVNRSYLRAIGPYERRLGVAGAEASGSASEPQPSEGQTG